MKTKSIILTLIAFMAFMGLSACTNEPSATIRDVEKSTTQVTISVFIEDPSDMIDQFDVYIMDESTILSSATNRKEENSLEGLWDITLPFSDVESGTYTIVVSATLSDGDTIELVTDSLEWP